MSNNGLILLLRGHIRDAFRDAELYNFINKLCNVYTVKVYIHTWSKYASSVSWRKVNENPRSVTQQEIMNYFFGLKWQIESLVIEDDQSISLIGDTSGNIYSTLLPKIAWKRMWYGIDRTASLIAEKEGSEVMVLNTRFDVFNNSNSLKDYNTLLRFIGPTDSKGSDTIHYNRFLRDSTQLIGIDNFYVGTVRAMATLASRFHRELDDLNMRYYEVYYQEVTVYYENRRLFLGDDRDTNIENYYYKNSADFKRLQQPVQQTESAPYRTITNNVFRVTPLRTENNIRGRPVGPVAPKGIKSSPAPPIDVGGNGKPKINIKHTTTNWGNWKQGS